MKITVQTLVNAPLAKVWNAWNNPSDIKQWNAASEDWHTTQSTVDLREGGKFTARMEAKDGSFGFDFDGTYTRIVPHKLIEFRIGDRPKVAFGADFGINLTTLGQACRIELPGGIIAESFRGPFRRLQSGKTLRVLLKRIGASQHGFDAIQVLQSHRRSEVGRRRRVGRQIDQRGYAERFSCIADEGLLDGSIILRPPEPGDRPDRREAHRRIAGMEVILRMASGSEKSFSSRQ